MCCTSHGQQISTDLIAVYKLNQHAEKASMQRNDSKEVNHILKPNQLLWHAILLNMFIMFTSLALKVFSCHLKRSYSIC